MKNKKSKDKFEKSLKHQMKNENEKESGGETQWLPLATKGVIIEDVTSKTHLQQVQKWNEGLSDPSSNNKDKWFILPQHESHIEHQGTEISGSDSQRKTECPGCRQASIIEKKLRERLKMTASFIHTMNHNLEVDAVEISKILNRRATNIELLEKRNLSLHQEKNSLQTQLSL